MRKPATETFRGVHTALVSDVCDDLDLDSPMLTPAIQRVAGQEGRVVVGPAFPCQVKPTDEYVEIHTLLEMIGSIPAGAIPVVVGVDGFAAALWGGLMSAGAKHRGAPAAVTNGLVRDVDQIAGTGFEVFGRGRTALDIRRRGAMCAFDVTVALEGRTISPGDMVVADGNGVAIVASDVVDRVANECEARIDRELATFRGLEAGEPPARLFARYGQF